MDKTDALDNFGSNYAVQSIIQEQDGLTEVSLSIIDTEALNQVDSVTVRGSAEDTLALYDQSVAAVVKMLDELSRPEPLAPRAYEAYRRGIDHLRRFDVEGNPERAVEAFEEALSIDPYNPPAYAGLAEAFLRLDDREPDSPWLARAQENAERAVELDNRLAYARVTLGIIRHRLGDREGAAEQLEKAITLNPQYADAHRELARVYQSLGKTGKAEQEFARVVPRDWRFFLSRGVFYFGQGRYGDAALDFESVIKENPDSHLAFRNLGGVYIMMGRYSEASAALQNAITIRQEARSYSNLGVSLYYQGEFRDAAEAFSRAIQEGAGRHIVYGNLGDAQHWAGETGKAVGSFKKAIEVGTRTLDQQENEITRVQIAAYQAKLGACDSARATLAELEKSKRDDLTVQARSALALGLCGQTNAAFDLLGQAIEGGYSIAEIEYDPWFTGLRSSDRFQTLVTEHRQSR